MIEPFRFRQFAVRQDKCAMKVGTDGVLLGAYVKDPSGEKVLDIGTGTGLLALMMAQRSNSPQILALEIDPDACKQAAENFDNSPWKNRLQAKCISLQDFTKETELQFDLIVSNPPYFKQHNRKKGNNQQQTEEQRAKARFTESLSYDELLNSVKKLLKPAGKFWLILPYENFGEFNEKAAALNIYLQHHLDICGKEGKPFSRCILCYGNGPSDISSKEMDIYTAEGVYSEKYKLLTREFYL